MAEDRKNVKSLAPRLGGLDFARGLAICLMIYSHGIVGLIPFPKLEGGQLIPTHLITKFSSSLFILVFGISLALFYLPYVAEPNFFQRQKKLFFRGVEILVWYKVLTFVQMFHIYERQDIIDALLFKRFPDFVEILGFYGIFMMWFPWVMKAWARVPLWVQPVIAGLLVAAGQWLTENSEFAGYRSIKILLVETPGEYTFGQFQRGGLVLFGLFLGSLWSRTRFQKGVGFQALLMLLGIAMAALFQSLAQPDLTGALTSVAGNIGKHPPNLLFMSFSLAGAFLILSLSLLMTEVPAVLKPLVWLGERSLQAFVFHIFVIFVLYRYLLDFRHNVPYEYAMWLTILLIGLTMLWCWAVKIKNGRWSV